MNYDIDIAPENVQAFIDRAHQMRAEAIRASFADFKGAVKGAFVRVAHVFSIPRTEQL